jgi:8-oxo-dGTP pyrophosphatase MutT (NUDIX family)
VNHEPLRWKANVTVAAVIEMDHRFLMIEEESDGLTVINQPAGHLEKDETLINAVKREVLEETAWDFEPEKIVGVYLYPNPHIDVTYLRICFSGSCLHHHAQRKLDEGIIRAFWITKKELETQTPKLRSPLVIRCIDDYLAGSQYPLDLLHHYES